jgi:hypothetical protein
MNNFESIGKDHYFMNDSVFLTKCMLLTYERIILIRETIAENEGRLIELKNKAPHFR